jgi:hypothetical protein
MDTSMMTIAISLIMLRRSDAQVADIENDVPKEIFSSEVQKRVDIENRTFGPA